MAKVTTTDIKRWILNYRIKKYREQIKKEFGIDADKFILEVT